MPTINNVTKPSIERVTTELFSIGNFSFDTVVLNGTKKNDGMRKDSTYYNEYKSEKYSNVDTLNSLDVRIQSYFAINYKGYDENNNFESYSVYMNAKNFYNFKCILNSAYDKLSAHVNEIYVNNRIAPEYEDFILEQSGYFDDGTGFGNIDGAGDILMIYPVMCVTPDGNSTYQGIGMYIEAPDGRTYVQEMAVTTFYSIVETINNYNLSVMSLLTYIVGEVYQNGGNATIQKSGVSRTPGKQNIPPRSPMGNRRLTLTEAMNSRKVVKPSNVNNTPVDDSEVVEDNTEEVIPPRKTVTPKNTKTPVKKAAGGSKLSLTDILNQAENVEVNLDEDEDGEEY